MKIGTRIITAIILMAGIAFAVIYRHEIHPTAIRNGIVGNPLAPIIFLALQVAASLLFVPRAVLGVAAGMLFGLFWGSVWAIVGAMIGASAGFALVRLMGFAGVLDTEPAVGTLIAKAEEGGWRAVAVVRLVPIPHSVANTVSEVSPLCPVPVIVAISLLGRDFTCDSRFYYSFSSSCLLSICVYGYGGR